MRPVAQFTRRRARLVASPVPHRRITVRLVHVFGSHTSARPPMWSATGRKRCAPQGGNVRLVLVLGRVARSKTHQRRAQLVASATPHRTTTCDWLFSVESKGPPEWSVKRCENDNVRLGRVLGRVCTFKNYRSGARLVGSAAPDENGNVRLGRVLGESRLLSLNSTAAPLSCLA